MKYVYLTKTSASVLQYAAFINHTKFKALHFIVLKYVHIFRFESLIKLNSEKKGNLALKMLMPYADSGKQSYRQLFLCALLSRISFWY